MTLKVVLAVCLCFWLDGALAARVQGRADANETLQEGSEMACANYCVYCNDGSTVWYGRSRSWFRSFISLFTEGLIVPITGVMNMFFKASREDYTHWTGYLPTTGMFCEKVDVIKFEAGTPWNAFTPWMLYDRNWFGKVTMNELKPYLHHGHDTRKDWAQEGDYEAYADGCKTVKAAGAKGSSEQFFSNFQGFCHSQVTQGVFKCSEHSRLCGKSGVHSMLHADSYKQCQALKGVPPKVTQCTPPEPDDSWLFEKPGAQTVVSGA